MIIWISSFQPDSSPFFFLFSANFLFSSNKHHLQNIFSSSSNLRIKVQSRGPFYIKVFLFFYLLCLLLWMRVNCLSLQVHISGLKHFWAGRSIFNMEEYFWAVLSREEYWPGRSIESTFHSWSSWMCRAGGTPLAPAWKVNFVKNLINTALGKCVLWRWSPNEIM